MIITHTIRHGRCRAGRWWRWSVLALLIAWFGSNGGWMHVGATAAPLPPPAAVLVVPAIADAPRAAQARGIFYRQTLAVTLPVSSVWLAASPDGQAALCTDDRATLTFARADQPVERWSHHFSRDRRALSCIPPQMVVVPAPGSYQITVELEDLYPDTYGTRPYYLVFAEHATAMTHIPNATAVAGLVSATASAFVATPQRSSAAAGLGTVLRSSDSPTPTPHAPAPQLGAAADETHAAPHAPDRDRRMLVLLGSALLVALLLALAVMRRRARQRANALAQPIGIVDLFDQATREAHTALLLSAPQGAEVRRGPLRLVPLPADNSDRTGIARIVPTPRGVLLREITAASTSDGQLLIHDVAYQLAGGAVTLCYRDQRVGRSSATVAGHGPAAPMWEARKE
jgi:hypothetical protein